MTVKTIGILGAGKLGFVLAQLALKAGYRVYIAGSGATGKISLCVNVLAPGAVAGTGAEVIAHSDVIILALPLGKFRTLPVEALTGKLVIDAMNYWWEVDGPRSDIMPDDETSSEAVQRYLAASRVVKTFNHMGYHDLFDEAKPPGAPDRKAIAIAGDNPEDVATASTIVDQLGFDPLVIGTLQDGVRLEAGQPAFGANVTSTELKKLVHVASASS